MLTISFEIGTGEVNFTYFEITSIDVNFETRSNIARLIAVCLLA